MRFCLVSLLFFLLSGFNLFSQQDKDYYAFMRDAVNDGEYELALNVYSRAIAEDYYNVEALDRLLCRVFYKTKKNKEAVELADRLYEQDESDLLCELICCSSLCKDKKQQSKVAERLGEFDISNVPKSVLQDLEHIDKQDLKTICQFIDRYLQKNKISDKQERRPYKQLQTLLYFVLGNYMQTYNCGVDFLTEDNVAVLDYIFGRVKQDRKEFISAIAFYNSAIRKGYTLRDAYLQRAVCKGESKDYKDSNVDLDTCLLIKEEPYAYYLKGINYNLMKDYNNSVYCFGRAITICDTFAEAYNYRGIVYANAKKYDFALMDFKTALQWDPDTRFIHDNIGLALEYMGNIQGAKKEYELSIDKEPKYFDAYYNLGRLYTYEHNNSKALRYLKKALEFEKEISDIYFFIGLNLEEQGKKDKALNHYKQALSLGHSKAEEKIKSILNPEIVAEPQQQNEEQTRGEDSGEVLEQDEQEQQEENNE